MNSICKNRDTACLGILLKAGVYTDVSTRDGGHVARTEMTSFTFTMIRQLYYCYFSVTFSAN